MHHSTPSAAHRYAVSYAPNPGSLGWLAGSHWLGRCAALGLEGAFGRLWQQSPWR